MATKRERLIARLLRKPVRVCNSLHECRLCGRDILIGDRYHDGGYGSRAHEQCVQFWTEVAPGDRVGEAAEGMA